MKALLHNNVYVTIVAITSLLVEFCSAKYKSARAGLGVLQVLPVLIQTLLFYSRTPYLIGNLTSFWAPSMKNVDGFTFLINSAIYKIDYGRSIDNLNYIVTALNDKNFESACSNLVSQNIST